MDVKELQVLVDLKNQYDNINETLCAMGSRAFKGVTINQSNGYNFVIPSTQAQFVFENYKEMLLTQRKDIVKLALKLGLNLQK